MFCPECGTRTRPGQKFCAECGFDLRSLQAGDESPEDVNDDGFQVADDLDETSDSNVIDVHDVVDVDDRPPDPTDNEMPTIQTASEPIVFEAPTPGSVPDPRQPAQGVDPMLARPPGVSSPPQDRQWSVTGQQVQVSGSAPAPPSWSSDADATTQMPTSRPPMATGPAPWQPAPTSEAPTLANTPRVQADQTAVYGMPRGPVTTEQPYLTGEMPWEWDGVDVGPGRPPVRFRLVVLPAVAAVAAAVLAVTRSLVEISGTLNPALDGFWKVNDFGTNNTVAAILAMVATFLGAVLWCAGFRWGAGLAGGGGLALAGWAGLLIGLSEWRIADAERVAATVAITRDIGYWGLVAAVAAGVLTFVASLSGAGRDRDGGLDPWIAALGATSVLVAAGGPLIPLGDADITANWDSATLAVDLPSLFFAGRLVQLGLFAIAGIIGFLLVRRYGLGMAIGGATVAGFQLVTSAIGQTATPIGPGYANPGSGGVLTPHGVTVVGMALAGFFAVVAVIMALLDREDRL